MLSRLKILQIGFAGAIAFFVFSFLWSSPDDYVIGKDSIIYVSGTSTLNKWQVRSNEIQGSADVKLENNILKSINKIHVSLKSKSLKSDNKILDKHTYKALNADEYENIEFDFTEVKSMAVKNDKVKVKVAGILKIAGVSKQVEVNAGCFVKDGILISTGNSRFRLSDFKIDPPKLALGALKAGDDITVDFEVNFKSKKLSNYEKESIFINSTLLFGYIGPCAVFTGCIFLATLRQKRPERFRNG